MKGQVFRAVNLSKVLEKFVSVDENLYLNSEEMIEVFTELNGIHSGQLYELTLVDKYNSRINFNRVGIEKCIGLVEVVKVYTNKYVFLAENGKTHFVTKNDLLIGHACIRPESV